MSLLQVTHCGDEYGDTMAISAPFCGLSPHEPDDSKPDHRRDKADKTHVRHGQGQYLRHHVAHSLGKQGVSRPFKHQRQTKGDKQVGKLHYRFVALVDIYCFFSPEALPKKRMKSLSGESTSEVSLSKAFS